MSPEQEERLKRVAEERHALRTAMCKLPFDFSTAGSTRIMAFKHAMTLAERVLNREPTDVAPYTEARLRLLAVGTADPEDLAKEMWS